MKGTFEFKLRNGSTCTIKATYECVMENEIVNDNGEKITLRSSKPKTAGKCNMTAYIDGKKYNNCWNPSFWGLIESKENPQKKVIWGLNIGFWNDEDAIRYEEWIAKIIDGGKSDEVKAYEKEMIEKEINRIVESAKKTIEKAESQKEIPTKEEVKKKEKWYNDIYNEGNDEGDVYIPWIVSIEEYKHAKEVLAKYGN